MSIMLSRLRFLLLLPVATLIACGGASTPPIGTSYTPVSGDYVITVGIGTAGQSTFTGNLLVTGTSVSGVFRYLNPGTICVSSSQDIPFTGSYQSNVLTLTSTAFSNSVATFTIKLPFGNNNLNQQLASGTAVIAGGTCALASSTLQAQFVTTFNGGWTISITSPAATYPLAVTQSAANSDGEFPVTGSLACGGTLINLSGLVSGPNLQLSSNLGQPAESVIANNSVAPVGVSISGTCSGTGTMQ
jgi:hypothetical protein